MLVLRPAPVPLLFTQASAVLTNETTIESSINYRMRHRNPRFRNPYNVGTLENIRQFMGESPWEWLVPRPLPRTARAGLVFPMRRSGPAEIV